MEFDHSYNELLDATFIIMSLHIIPPGEVQPREFVVHALRCRGSSEELEGGSIFFLAVFRHLSWTRRFVRKTDINPRS